ncbi:MAG: cyclodeaminase/cyclohydrolase family protein [Bacillota bacterium]
MQLMDRSVKNFSEELASSSPAPGGGTIAAVNGVFAAGLGEMVCALSSQSQDPNAQAVMRSAADALKAARERLLALADEDTEAFNRVMEAYRLPKATDGEKVLRKEKIAQAVVGATRVPMDTAAQAIAVCNLLARIAVYANSNVLSDCGVAIECARTAAWGAFMNVAINLPGVKDEKLAAAFAVELDSLKKELSFYYDAASAVMSKRFAY